jgi:hypothetical protein
MNKNTKALMDRAEHEGMVHIVPIKWLSAPILQKLSKKAFGVQFCNYRANKDAFVFDLTGSPADIRKGIKYVEYLDITPTFCNFHIMREGRTYNLFVSEGQWAVSRVHDIHENTEPYTCITETLTFNYDEYDVLPEAICESEFEF